MQEAAKDIGTPRLCWANQRAAARHLPGTVSHEKLSTDMWGCGLHCTHVCRLPHTCGAVRMGEHIIRVPIEHIELLQLKMYKNEPNIRVDILQKRYTST